MSDRHRELIVRSITGIICACVLYASCMSNLSSLLFVMLISFECYYELSKQMSHGLENYYWVLIIAYSVIILMESSGAFVLFSNGLIFYMICFTVQKTPNAIFVLLYTILLPLIMIRLISSNDTGFNTQLFMHVLSCWVVDIACFISGRLSKFVGKSRLIHPFLGSGKTWEGSIGGYLLGVVIVFFVQKNYTTALILPLLSILGDIFESWLKRMLNIKDFGNTFPGHGGFLDRFDSVLFSSLIILFQ